jgi:glyoxylase-like metal-dependent hydrolase (beta-lactamase superfamily II)
MNRQPDGGAASEEDDRIEIVPEVPRALSPLVRRITADNPGVFTGPGTNTYLVGIDEIVVIDPGPADDAHLDTIAACGGDRIRWIALTHTHEDHSPGAAGLIERTGAELIGFASTDELTMDMTFGDGDTLEGTEFRIDAVHTPGHASDHLCWLLPNERLLFSGDHLMEGSTVVIAPPDGHMATYLDSLRKVRELRLRAIAPGHGHLIREPRAYIDFYLDHRAQREQKVAETLARIGPATIPQLVAEAYDDVPTEKHWIAEKSMWAQLIKMVDEGAAVGDDPEGTWQVP